MLGHVVASGYAPSGRQTGACADHDGAPLQAGARAYKAKLRAQRHALLLGGGVGTIDETLHVLDLWPLRPRQTI